MSTQRVITGNTSTQNIDFSQSGLLTLNATTKVNVSSVINAPTYQKNGLDADVVKLGNSYTPANLTTVGLSLPATFAATGYTTIFGAENLTNSTAGGGVSSVFGTRNLLSATFTGLGEIVHGDRNLQTLQTGNNNVAIGTFNANAMTTGTSNTFLGGFHAQVMTTGSNNICIGQGTTLPSTCDHSISMGTSVTGAANQFTFGTGTNFTRFASGCTSNTVDLGSTTQRFKSAHIGTSILGAGTQSIALTGNDITLTGTNIPLAGVPSCTQSAHATLLSTGALTSYANAYTVLNPIRLITMTSNAGLETPTLFTVGAAGALTYNGTATVLVYIDVSYSYANTTNSAANMTHWISVNGSLTAPTNNTPTGTRTFLNALNNIFIPESFSTTATLSTGNTIQLIGSITSAAALTVNYRSICYRVRAQFI
jgi:hypothetical protein